MSRDFIGALLQLNAEKGVPREQLIHTGFLQEQVHGIRIDRLLAHGLPIELREYGPGRPDPVLGTTDLEQVAPVTDLHTQAFFQMVDILIERTTERGQAQ